MTRTPPLHPMIRLAYAGLHPARLAELVEDAGSAEAALRDLRRGRVALSRDALRRLRLSDATLRRGLDASGAQALVAPWTSTAAVVGTASDASMVWAGLADADPPVHVLFVRGRPSAFPGVGIVGTRRATRYGRALATSMGSAVARAGVPVVSGLARGIDGAAHEGALAAGGPTVAVLGCGIDRCYPAEHQDLLERIVASGGAVISEYPPGAPPLPWRFPPRNRIIAALSAAVVVVEAGLRGGALITARQAAEQGREVFAVPGDVDRPSSEGCNRLIRDGAHPVLGPDDLIEALSLLPTAVMKVTDGDGDGAGQGGTASGDDEPRWLLEAVGPAGIGLAELAERSPTGPVGLGEALARLERAGRLAVRGGWVQRL